MSFDFSYVPEGITLRARPETAGLLGRLFSRKTPDALNSLIAGDRALTFALADLRALGDEHPGTLEIDGDTIRMTHALAAALDSQTAEALGFPPVVDLVFRTDVEGALGTPSFRLRHDWLKSGRKQVPQRVGAILNTSDGPRRLPSWLLEAVEVAEAFTPGRDEAAHWEALARFRQALDPGVQMVPDSAAARVSMTDFLQGLEVRLADRFSIAPVERAEGLDFEVVPFSGKKLDSRGGFDDEVQESEGELDGTKLKNFQERVRDRGALSAYRVGEGSYLVIDRAATPVLQTMALMQRASPAERAAFVRNPRPLITQAVERALRSAGKLDNLTPAGEEEAIEAIAGPVLVETREYSERVTGLTPYRKPSIDVFQPSGTTWLPEYFPPPLVQALSRMNAQELQNLSDDVRGAISEGQTTVEVAGENLPATAETLRALELRQEACKQQEELADAKAEDGDRSDRIPSAPIIIDTKDNFEDLQWRPERGPRIPLVPRTLPAGIRTALKEHQIESLNWQIEAWAAGLPGILNADEQGLGKTLQTIAFLRWLKSHMALPDSEARGPVLIVAPTSLLENWEAEVQRHLDEAGLGHLIRLYGSGLGGHRRTGMKGVDTDYGEERLDFELLHEAVREGRGHRFWLLTTYTTLTNYQHSLAKIPFSAAVFDEIQALKNPVSLRAFAARAVRADFRIGLTGTPIENSATDLWAIMDQLCPGALDTLRQFRDQYGVPNAENMEQLHARTFLRQNGLPPLAIRRLKEDVARELPEKTRRLYPRAMPDEQSIAYEDARLKLAEGSRGAALKMLHHIRSVSVHPSVDSAATNSEYIRSSGRLSASFEILRRIQAQRERALVFIEHRKMQHRFIELARQEFGLHRIDLINGDTPIQKRQAIVDRFQRHLIDDGGFDLLVLGPKAAGTGLTLTAATHVIHLSRWWNPSVEEQCNDRVHRIGQTRAVTVHVPMAIHPGYREHSFDCLLHSLMNRKRRLASSALWPMGDTADDAAELQRMVAAEGDTGVSDPVPAAMAAMFARDNVILPPFEDDGSLVFR